MLDSANSCPYGKWIGEVTDQPVMYVANAAKVGATTGAVRLQASTNVANAAKVGAIDDFAADLKEIFKDWHKKNDCGTHDPVLTFGVGGSKFDLARMLSKPVKAKEKFQRGVWCSKCFIKKGDRYVKTQWFRCIDEDNHSYVGAEEDMALLCAIVHTDTDLSVENTNEPFVQGNACSRNKAKQKKKGRSTAATKEQGEVGTPCLRLSDENRICVIRAGLHHFG
mmetsp:Transcript_64645/g.121158  ORF Transcript_64645/g.121158 Transcript_64645/m.121158 type:complete len:223 (+) Transcript_64645:184-852(+)